MQKQTLHALLFRISRSKGIYLKQIELERGLMLSQMMVGHNDEIDRSIKHEGITLH